MDIKLKPVSINRFSCFYMRNLKKTTICFIYVFYQINNTTSKLQVTVPTWDVWVNGGNGKGFCLNTGCPTSVTSTPLLDIQIHSLAYNNMWFIYWHGCCINHRTALHICSKHPIWYELFWLYVHPLALFCVYALQSDSLHLICIQHHQLVTKKSAWPSYRL